MKRLLSVARHEAAHAVAHEILGNRVRVVRITGRSNGYCEYAVRGRPDPLVEGIAALAGHAADIRWRRAKRTMVAAHDHRCVVRLGFRGRSLPTLLEMASGLVGAHAALINRVASELVSGDLTGKRVRALMRGDA